VALFAFFFSNPATANRLMLAGLEKKNALVREMLGHGALIVAGGEEQLSLDKLPCFQA
jgi:hypothetical protein